MPLMLVHSRLLPGRRSTTAHPEAPLERNARLGWPAIDDDGAVTAPSSVTEHGSGVAGAGRWRAWEDSASPKRRSSMRWLRSDERPRCRLPPRPSLASALLVPPLFARNGSPHRPSAIGVSATPAHRAGLVLAWHAAATRSDVPYTRPRAGCSPPPPAIAEATSRGRTRANGGGSSAVVVVFGCDVPTYNWCRQLKGWMARALGGEALVRPSEHRVRWTRRRQVVVQPRRFVPQGAVVDSASSSMGRARLEAGIGLGAQRNRAGARHTVYAASHTVEAAVFWLVRPPLSIPSDLELTHFVPSARNRRGGASESERCRRPGCGCDVPADRCKRPRWLEDANAVGGEGLVWPRMHRCFLIYEILELLCEAVFYQSENEDDVDRPSLLALLKTCRAFSLPATKLLWRSLTSIVPLILAMPRDLVDVRPERMIFAFRRATLPGDWERFDFYAPFVKQMRSLPSYQLADLDDSIRHELGKRNKILLPNLGTISVKSANRSFWTPGDEATFRPTLETALDSLDLEDFHCDLFRLSDHMLETLCLQGYPEPSAHAPLISTPSSSVEGISVFTDNGNFGPSAVAQILVALQPSQLEMFHLLPGGRGMSDTTEEMRDLVSAINTNCSPKFLKHFKLEGWRPKSSESPTILDSQLLRPLFAFSNLQSFILAAYPFNFTDADVKDLAMSWPRLEKLFFDTSVEDGSQTQTRTTLRCLLWFAIYCPNLRPCVSSSTG
ncbi:hypothetical protein BJ912DRAFT_1042654 [Pholiota molesta]|nr:hypothetical protein BJ912DRAFT_1042654 [Pholiota molesta]